MIKNKICVACLTLIIGISNTVAAFAEPLNTGVINVLSIFVLNKSIIVNFGKIFIFKNKFIPPDN